jgi:hypothetical protein
MHHPLGKLQLEKLEEKMKREGVIVSICCFYINLGIESEAGSILSILGRILFVLVWL